MQILEAQSKCFYSKTFFLKPCVCLSIICLRWSGLKTILHENVDQKNCTHRKERAGEQTV